jgi:DNA-binding GntR family transcriptional regulator
MQKFDNCMQFCYHPFTLMDLCSGMVRMNAAFSVRKSPIIAASDDASLSEAVYQRLLESILTGAYPQGAVLSELGVAREFKVSRTPVHDALRQLSKDGLVVRERNCRARVAGLTVDDIFEVFEMRKLLEGPATELAAARMDARQLLPLQQFAAELKEARRGQDWTARWAEFDDQFHSTIATASGNRRLAQDIHRYRLLHKGFNRLATEPEGLQQALAEHVSILAALEAHDGQLARERMIAHIAAWQVHFIKHLPQSAASATRPANARGEGRKKK